MSSNSFHAATFTVESASDLIGNTAIIIVGGVPDRLLGNNMNTSGLAINLSDLVALNPQPLPPLPPDRTFGISFGITTQLDNPLDLVGLNPQPLPPRELFGSVFGNALFRFGHW